MARNTRPRYFLNLAHGCSPFFSRPCVGLFVQVEQRQDALRLFIHDDLGTDTRQYCLHGLEIDTPPRYFRGLAVLLEQGIETARVTLGLVDPFQPVAVRFADTLILFTFGKRDDLVVVAPRLVDQFFLFLLRLVNLVERLLHRTGRVDVFQLHLVDADAHGILAGEFLHL